jgi:Xaa-Pro aminopeptidase
MKALELTAEQLIQLKIITNKNDVHKYFPHAIGHFLGLDVHDVGDYTKPLAENMVITVEPGIYIPEIGIGVRIEDDILVTKTGAKVL